MKIRSLDVMRCIVGICSCVVLLLLPGIILAQSKSSYVVNGFVTDLVSGETLIGATIYETASKRGAVTNEFGYFSLPLSSPEAHLRISYVGYEMQEMDLALQADTTLHVALQEGTMIETVVVLGQSSNPSGIETSTLGAQRIAASQIKMLPNFLGEADVLKALQLLPGVQGGTEGSAGLYVRGGGPDQNLILMDGILLYNPNHLLGFFSAFNPDAVKSVTLHKGTFPSRFGGRLSSVVDVRLKDGDQQEYHGNVSLGLISSKINLEGPIVRGRTTFNVSARRTYMDALFWAARKMAVAMGQTDPMNENSAGYSFHDLNLKLTHRFSEDDQLYFFAYHGGDQVNTTMKEKKSSISNTKMRWYWGNTMASLRWNHVINGQMFLNTTASYTSYRSRLRYKTYEEQSQSETNHMVDVRYDSGLHDLLTSSELHYTPHPDHQLLFGVNYTYHRFRPEIASIYAREQGELMRGPNDDKVRFAKVGRGQVIPTHEVAVYAEDEMKLGDQLRINAGLRYNLFWVRQHPYHSIEPRMGVAWRITPALTAKLGYAMMSQHVHLLSNNALSLPTDLWVPSTDRILPMISHQISGGMFLRVPDWGDFSVEGYYKPMKNIVEYREGAAFIGFSEGWEQLVAMGDGTAYGVEFLWQRNLGKVTGWLGYTWSRALRHFNRKGEELNFGVPFPARYDRIHDFSVAMTYHVNERWDLSATWVFATGNTATLATQEYPTLDDPTIDDDRYVDRGQIPYVSNRNNYRAPMYHRMDLGVTYTAHHRHGRSLWNLSIYNVYNKKNPFLTIPTWETDPNSSPSNPSSSMKLMELTIFPIMPNLSYTYSF